LLLCAPTTSDRCYPSTLPSSRSDTVCCAPQLHHQPF
jgi:hypothetical protein